MVVASGERLLRRVVRDSRTFVLDRSRPKAGQLRLFFEGTLGGFRLEHTQYKNIPGLVKAVKELVLENCDHDINLHHSFKSAKKQKCNKCGLLVTK